MWKGEIARHEQFLLFTQCFQPIKRTFCHFHQMLNCRLQALSIWRGLKFAVWERVKVFKIEDCVVELNLVPYEFAVKWNGYHSLSQCVHKSDCTFCTVWSSSTLFVLVTSHSTTAIVGTVRVSCKKSFCLLSRCKSYQILFQHVAIPDCTLCTVWSRSTISTNPNTAIQVSSKRKSYILSRY